MTTSVDKGFGIGLVISRKMINTTSPIKTYYVSPHVPGPAVHRLIYSARLVTINTYEDCGVSGGRRILIVEFSEHFIDTTTNINEVIALEELVCAHLHSTMMSTRHPSFPVSLMEDLQILHAFYCFVAENVFVYTHGSRQFAIPFPCQIDVSSEVEQALLDDFTHETVMGALGAPYQGLLRAQTDFYHALHDARYQHFWSLDRDTRAGMLLVQDYILAMIECARFSDGTSAIAFEE